MAEVDPVGYDQMSGIQKAATVLVLLGKEVASDVFRKLNEGEAGKLAHEISNISEVSPEVKQRLLDDFFAGQAIMRGGIDFAKDVLERSKGSKGAAKILESVSSAFFSDDSAPPFEFLRKVDKAQLVSILQEEQPQTIALILSHVSSDDASMILGELPQEVQTEVAGRIAMMDQTSPDMVRQIENILKSKLESFLTQDVVGEVGGVKSLVEILNKVDRTTEGAILDSLTETNPELAEEVKNMMFMFEDIKLLDDQAIQRVLKDVETKDLVIALKTASDIVKEKIFRNMSERAVETLKEEMEFTGPVRVNQVEEAQLKVVRVIKNLEAAEEIYISRGGEEEMFV